MEGRIACMNTSLGACFLTFTFFELFKRIWCFFLRHPQWVCKTVTINNPAPIRNVDITVHDWCTTRPNTKDNILFPTRAFTFVYDFCIIEYRQSALQKKLENMIALTNSGVLLSEYAELGHLVLVDSCQSFYYAA